MHNANKEELAQIVVDSTIFSIVSTNEAPTFGKYYKQLLGTRKNDKKKKRKKHGEEWRQHFLLSHYSWQVGMIVLSPDSAMGGTLPSVGAPLNTQVQICFCVLYVPLLSRLLVCALLSKTGTLMF